MNCVIILTTIIMAIWLFTLGLLVKVMFFNGDNDEEEILHKKMELLR